MREADVYEEVSNGNDTPSAGAEGIAEDAIPDALSSERWRIYSSRVAEFEHAVRVAGFQARVARALQVA